MKVWNPISKLGHFCPCSSFYVGSVSALRDHAISTFRYLLEYALGATITKTTKAGLADVSLVELVAFWPNDSLRRSFWGSRGL